MFVNTAAIFGFVNNGKTEFCKFLQISKNLDSTTEEKKRGMTIQLGQTYIQDKFRNTLYLFLDTPGHAVLTTRLIAGLNLVTIPIFLISCYEPDSGLKRAAFFINMLKILKIEKLVIIISKTDLVTNDELALFQTNLKIQFQEFEVGYLCYNKFMTVTTVKEQLFRLISEFEFKPAITTNLVIRSFNVNCSNTPIETLNGGILGVWGTEKITEGQKLFVVPCLFKNTYDAIPFTVKKIILAGTEYAKTIETDILFSETDKNKFVGASLQHTKPVLLFKIIFYTNYKKYEKNESLIMVNLNSEHFCKVTKIVGVKRKMIYLELNKPATPELLKHGFQMCKKIDNAWCLVETVSEYKTEL